MTSPLLDVKNLRVDLPTERGLLHAVRGIDFHVNRGEMLCLVGESGCGKSMTSLALMGLLPRKAVRTADHIRFDGVDLQTLPEKGMTALRGARMAMIFQEPMTSLNPSYTLGDQLCEALRAHRKVTAAEARDRAVHLLERAGVPQAADRMRQYPHQLSGGLRQRVMIAMALMCGPDLIIADEPTTALDVTIQAQILQLIRQLQEEMDMGVIFITHDMGVVAEVADRVLVMYRGEKVEDGTSDEIFSAPQHPYTRALLSAVPRLGAMNGTDAPAPFPLLEVAQAAAGVEAVPVAPPTDTVRRENGPILQIRNLVTRFDIPGGILGRTQRRVHAVEQVSFDLFPGETLSLVGESGCGKTTTGRSLLQLVKSQSGDITFDGQNIRTLRGSAMQRLRQHIQIIFQDPFASLDPRMTVGYSIMEPLLIHNVARGRKAQERVRWLMDKCGLSPEMIDRYPHEFSGGQRQRICIARALALNPKVVIADESVSALDVSIQAQIVNLLLDLQRELGVSFLFISHDMAVVERVSHRVAVMYLGQIVEIGPRRAVFEAPQHPYTKKLMSAVPVADPQRRHRQRSLLVDEIPSTVRALGDEPVVQPLVEVGPGHYVARHAVGKYS